MFTKVKKNMFSENGQPTQARYVFHCGAFMWKKRVRGFFTRKQRKGWISK